MGGIALATAALVVVMSVFNGFHTLISDRLSALEPPLSAIAAEGKTLSATDSLITALNSDPAIASATPIIEERALAAYNGRQQAIRLRGVRPELYPMFDSICPVGSPWEAYYPERASGVVSVGVANALEIPIGDEQLMEIYVPRRIGRINPANPMAAFLADSIAPSAAYIVNQPELDADIVYVPYSIAANLLQFNDEATEIYIYPSKSEHAAIEAAKRILSPNAEVKTMLQREGATFQIVNMEKWMTFFLLGFILLIASFNIISSLSLLIIEKEPNAAMLKALGAEDSMIRNIYRFIGLLITGLGTVAGLIGGIVLSLGQQYFGWVKLVGDASELTLQTYPVQFQWADIPAVAILAMLTGLITTAIATRR